MLAPDTVRNFVRKQFDAVGIEGRSVCVLVPDATRTCPLPLLMSAVHAALHGRVSRLTVVVALGTHAGLDERALSRLLGHPVGELANHYPGVVVRNHEWWDTATFAPVDQSCRAVNVPRWAAGGNGPCPFSMLVVRHPDHGRQ